MPDAPQIPDKGAVGRSPRQWAWLSCLLQPTYCYRLGRYVEAMLTMRLAWPDVNVFMQES